MCGETDVARASAGAEVGIQPGVEQGHIGGRHGVGANVVEKLYELLVLLAVDFRERDGDVWDAGERLRAEKIVGVVVRAEQTFLGMCHHRRELQQVADHEQLHAPEGGRRASVFAQGVVDGIEQVGAHHRNLIDYEQIERADYA